MKTTRVGRVSVLCALFICLVSPGVARSSGQYMLTVAGENMQFVAQPEAGYVVKVAQKPAGVSSMSVTLKLLQAKGATRIRGLDRHGVWVVEDKRPAGENEKTISALGSQGQVKYAAPLFSCEGQMLAVIPEIVARLKEGATQQDLAAVCVSMHLRIKKRMEFTMQEYLLEVLGPDADAVFCAVEQLNEILFVEWACPNTASRPHLAGQTAFTAERTRAKNSAKVAAGASATSGVFPNDEYFSKQWHLHNTGHSGGTPGADINAPEAWEITTGDPNIVVALPDSGVDLNHPDLIDNLVPGYDFLDDDSNPMDSHGHGTACAGLIAARGNNDIGLAGITWKCKVMPVRIEDDNEGRLCTDTDIATAFRWMANNGADVISNSSGYWANVPITHSAIIDITKPGGQGRDGKGCVVLDASANSGNNRVRYIGRYPEVIAVGATDHKDVLAWYSNYGAELDLVAPGGGGVVTYDPETYYSLSSGLLWTTDIRGIAGIDKYNHDPAMLDYNEKFAGTSAACPLAAGVAALILSVEPNLTNEEVRHFLTRSAKDLGDPGRDDYYGWGRVDARAALDMVLAKRSDLNDDWRVDSKDFACLAQRWQQEDASTDIAPAAARDGYVGLEDVILMCRYWQYEMAEFGLIAHWKLDETEGYMAHDSAGDHNAFVIGPVWRPTGGKINGALEFDGIDDYLSTPFVLDPADGAFSVFAWIKGGAPGQVIISQTQGGVNWLSADPLEGKLMTELKGTGRFGQPLISDAMIIDGQWHRVAFTWDGSNRILYVDGAEVATDTQSSLAGSQGGLYIAAGSNREAGSFLSGLIDDVRIYDRAIEP